MTDKPISKGPKKHNPECYQLQRDIVIPAGTILRSTVGDGEYSTEIGIPGLPRQSVTFRLYAPAGTTPVDAFKKVTAA